MLTVLSFIFALVVILCIPILVVFLIIKYILDRVAGRKKFSPLNEAVSLSEDEEWSGTNLLQTFQEEANPEKIYITKEKAKIIGDFIDNGLSDLERNVFELYITGMNYTEIAGVLGRDDKSTDNAIQRIRGKIKKVLESEINS